MFCVYILKSQKDETLYIGKTNNISRRLAEHNSGHTQSIKSKIPFVLLESIECSTELEARKLEKEYKKGYKREELKRKYKLNGELPERSNGATC
ncbi:MAG: GIY-YIG nuclease family protein [Patescibacteria group bacterium]